MSKFKYIEVDESEKEIAKAIHYPDCWDTMAYPSLSHALWEMIHFKRFDVCSQCGKAQGHIE